MDYRMNDKLTLPTISGLAINPALWLAKRYLETKDWEQCRKEAIEDNLMKIEKTASSARYLAYTMKLLRTLGDKELESLASHNAVTQRAMMWLAFCRTYPLIGKFADTVINQKFKHFKSPPRRVSARSPRAKRCRPWRAVRHTGAAHGPWDRPS